MEKYQEQYIDNTREILKLSDIYKIPVTDFESWYTAQINARKRAAALKQDNISLLNRYLFVTLDNLHDASGQDIRNLEEFSDVLMDWTTNLDCGVYVLIHDSLLSLYRYRKDRNNIIKELYKLGMGLYYQNKKTTGIENNWTRDIHFQNELVFTEAGSYIKFFAEIDDTETKGYIIRALANISITTESRRKRIAISSRMLKIIQDEYYRNLAPELPWDVYLRRTWQQLSATRSVLSRGDFSQEELAEVLEACQIVFEPEKNNDNPNIKWLWPFYEMEYSCGFVDLQTTLQRMEDLISSVKYDQYDSSSIYGNVQLPIYYGRLLRNNPSLLEQERYVDFLRFAYDKMMKCVMTYPIDTFDDFFLYDITLIITDYFETEGVDSYKDITTRLMTKLSGELYIRSQKAGEILKLISLAIFDHNSHFFDDIPFIAEISDMSEKRRTLEKYAEECGIYHDFGLIKMNMETLRQTRNFFEDEFQLFKLHTVSAHDDLAGRKSTAMFADIAYGHHRWYDSTDGYPESYIREESAYRQMTDIVALADYLIENYDGDMKKTVDEVISLEHRQFSPIITVYLHDSQLVSVLKKLLDGSDEPYYRNLYSHLISKKDTVTDGLP